MIKMKITKEKKRKNSMLYLNYLHYQHSLFQESNIFLNKL